MLLMLKNKNQIILEKDLNQFDSGYCCVCASSKFSIADFFQKCFSGVFQKVDVSESNSGTQELTPRRLSSSSKSSSDYSYTSDDDDDESSSEPIILGPPVPTQKSPAAK
jgi:hypothetical protein